MTRVIPVQFTMRQIIKTTEPHCLAVGDTAIFERSEAKAVVTVVRCAGPEHIEVDTDFGGLAHGGTLQCNAANQQMESELKQAYETSQATINELEAANQHLESELKRLTQIHEAEVEGPPLAPGMLLSSREGHVFVVVSCSLKSRANVAASPFSAPQIDDTTEVTLEQR